MKELNINIPILVTLIWSRLHMILGKDWQQIYIFTRFM